MKQILILLISVILFSCSDNEIRYHIDETTSPTDTLTYLKSDMSLLNGVMYCEFGDLGSYKNGRMDGIQKNYYWNENGQLKHEGNLKDGKKDGLQRSWYENGQLEYEKNYTDGKEDGLFKFWYDDGQLLFEGNYINGLRDGIHMNWYENGQLFILSKWKEGILYGKTERYKETGEKLPYTIQEIMYQNGEKIK
jgi:antitoxin component YwqK of YwqJK toxin-antitoxin module